MMSKLSRQSHAAFVSTPSSVIVTKRKKRRERERERERVLSLLSGKQPNLYRSFLKLKGQHNYLY
jgi:hypothetical protein